MPPYVTPWPDTTAAATRQAGPWTEAGHTDKAGHRRPVYNWATLGPERCPHPEDPSRCPLPPPPLASAHLASTASPCDPLYSCGFRCHVDAGVSPACVPGAFHLCAWDTWHTTRGTDLALQCGMAPPAAETLPALPPDWSPSPFPRRPTEQTTSQCHPPPARPPACACTPPRLPHRPPHHAAVPWARPQLQEGASRPPGCSLPRPRRFPRGPEGKRGVGPAADCVCVFPSQDCTFFNKKDILK